MLSLIAWSFSPHSIYSKCEYLPSLLLYCSLTLEGTLGPVYKPTHVFSPVSLASSVLNLHSNLVSSPGLPVWLKSHQLLITRLPSRKTLGNSMCPHTTLVCALLEIRLHRPHNKLVLLLCGLHNQISSSAHSSVVWGHVEFLSVFLEGNLVTKSWWGLSHMGSPREETRLLGRWCVELAQEREKYMGGFKY